LHWLLQQLLQLLQQLLQLRCSGVTKYLATALPHVPLLFTGTLTSRAATAAAPAALLCWLWYRSLPQTSASDISCTACAATVSMLSRSPPMLQQLLLLLHCRTFFDSTADPQPLTVTSAVLRVLLLPACNLAHQQ
jgi:hypothetical protein